MAWDNGRQNAFFMARIFVETARNLWTIMKIFFCFSLASGVQIRLLWGLFNRFCWYGLNFSLYLFKLWLHFWHLLRLLLHYFFLLFFLFRWLRGNLHFRLHFWLYFRWWFYPRRRLRFLNWLFLSEFFGWFWRSIDFQIIFDGEFGRYIILSHFCHFEREFSLIALEFAKLDFFLIEELVIGDVFFPNF